MVYKRKASIQKRLRLLLIATLGIIGWVAACTSNAAQAPSKSVRSPSSQSKGYILYLGTWAENSDSNKLVPLLPETLETLPDGTTLRPGTFSADGSTQVVVEYAEGQTINNPNLKPEDVWIVIYDLPLGIERQRFHPPTSGLVVDTSVDGARLLLQPFPFPVSPYPPPVEWYVLDTTSGATIAHIKDGDSACFRQRAILDPAGLRIYCVVDPKLTETGKPQAMRIVAYDVESGLKAQDVEIPQILVGGSMSEQDNNSVWEFLEPAITLSPDGQRLAIVHADVDKVTLINAQSLSVEKTLSLRRDVAIWDWLALATGVANAKGAMEGSIRQAVFSSDGRNLYVFSQEVWMVPEDAPAERGLWVVDLAHERLVAKALPEYQIQWLRPAPDGTVYAFGTTDERLLPYEIRTTSPSMLWHLDGRTLEILAERAFTGYRGGWLVGSANLANALQPARLD